MHSMSQKCPQVSGRVPDKCPDLCSSVFEIERSVNIVGDVKLKLFWVTDLDFRNQENSSMSRRVPNKCPDLTF